MMLVEQRTKWYEEYANGSKPMFPAYLDYIKNRNSEMFRLSSSMEQFFEYVRWLENEQAAKT